MNLTPEMFTHPVTDPEIGLPVLVEYQIDEGIICEQGVILTHSNGWVDVKFALSEDDFSVEDMRTLHPLLLEVWRAENGAS